MVLWMTGEGWKAHSFTAWVGAQGSTRERGRRETEDWWCEADGTRNPPALLMNFIFGRGLISNCRTKGSADGEEGAKTWKSIELWFLERGRVKVKEIKQDGQDQITHRRKTQPSWLGCLLLLVVWDQPGGKMKGRSEDSFHIMFCWTASKHAE